MSDLSSSTLAQPPYETLIEGRAAAIARYSPYSGVRGISSTTHVGVALRGVVEIEQGASEGGRRFDVAVGDGTAAFYVKRLAWDSEFWGREVYGLVHVLTDLEPLDIAAAARTFVTEIAPTLGGELRTEIPAEDVAMVQALTGAGFRSVVTQVVHIRDGLSDLAYPRNPVRPATEDDIESLRRTAVAMRNPYDRAHADVRTSDAEADHYLATFAEACVRGFTDIVLVPDRPKAESIVAVNVLADEWPRLGVNVSQIVLGAVSAATNRGWSIKFLYESLYLLREREATRVILKTQVQNYVVHRCTQMAGFRMAASTHLLAYP